MTGKATAEQTAQLVAMGDQLWAGADEMYDLFQWLAVGFVGAEPPIARLMAQLVFSELVRRRAERAKEGET